MRTIIAAAALAVILAGPARADMWQGMPRACQ